MTSRFGVHMGNTTVCLSIVKDNNTEIVASKFGDRASYAVIAAAENDEIVIGLPAKQGLVRQSLLTIVNNFQFLNEDLTADDIIEAKKHCVCEITDDPITYNLRKDDIERILTPFEVAVKLLTNLYENASQAAKSETSLEAVIAVPIHFSAKSRKALSNAAKEAGFAPLQMLSEPSACLLAYDIGLDATEKSNVLVVGIGGLSSDITLLHVEKGFYQEIGHNRLATLGGNVLSKALCEFMANEFRNKYKLDPRECRRTMIKLLQHAENCKHILSSISSAQVFIESLMDGVDWSQTISRARFENVISGHISTILRCIEELASRHNDYVVDKIIFCGGSLKIPKLQSAISNLFPNATTLSSIPPDEVIALGCAKQALYIGNGWDADGEHIDMDVSTLSSDIVIHANDDQSNPIVLEKGTPLPNERKFPAKYVDGKVKISVKQNDHIDIVDDCSPDDLDCMVRAKLQQGAENVLNFAFSPTEKSAQNRLYIKHGTVVNHDGHFKADVYVEDGKIKYVGPGSDFVVPGGVKIIDAAGRLLIPGGIDPHTHFQLPFGGTVSIDDFYKGTKAAVAGGTTTIIDFVIPNKNQSLIEAYDEWRSWADGKVCCDYGFHVAVTWWSKSVQKEMKILCEERGINSFKVFMAYKGLYQLDDTELYEVFETCKELGAVAMVHAENGSIIAKNAEKLLNAGVTGPEGHELSRNEEVEAEAVNRACIIAHQVKAPIFISHLTSYKAADIVSSARLRGITVFGDVLTGAIGCTLRDVKPSASLYYITSPPIRRDPETPRKLLKALALNHLQTTGSDNCTFNKDQKELGKGDFTKIPNGVNGVEDRMSVVWEKGVHGGLIDPCKFVAITSTNAAKIFNLYPQKGRIEAGSDADIVVWNPTATRVISASTHHQACDFNIFEGMTCHGVPECVIVKGRVCVEDGLLRVAEGYGTFLETPVSPPYVYNGINGIKNGDEEATNGDAKHSNIEEELAIEIPAQEPLTNFLSGLALSVSSDTTRASTPTGRAMRQDGQRNLQDSTFSISEEIDTSEQRSSIRVRNPPGGKSSGFW